MKKKDLTLVIVAAIVLFMAFKSADTANPFLSTPIFK